jgi:prepilin signal peptidase PulO-like enzyme (type II secretory pathway)
MSVPALSVQEPAAEPPAAERPPLRELLPTGTWRVLVGLGMVVTVVASFAHFGFTSHALVGAVLAPTLVLLTAIDAKHRLLPNVIVLPATLTVAVILAASDPRTFLAHLVVAAAAGGFFFAFAAFFPGALGIGDTKLVFLLGLALGGKVLGAIFIGFLAGLVPALYVIAKRGPAARKETIPYGPYLALGGLVVFFLS